MIFWDCSRADECVTSRLRGASSPLVWFEVVCGCKNRPIRFILSHIGFLDGTLQPNEPSGLLRLRVSRLCSVAKSQVMLVLPLALSFSVAYATHAVVQQICQPLEACCLR